MNPVILRNILGSLLDSIFDAILGALFAAGQTVTNWMLIILCHVEHMHARWSVFAFDLSNSAISLLPQTPNGLKPAYVFGLLVASFPSQMWGIVGEILNGVFGLLGIFLVIKIISYIPSL